MNQYIIKLKRIFASKYFFKILFLFSLIYLFLIVNIMPYKSIYNNYDNEFIGKVYKYKLNNNKLTIYLKSKENLLINYKVKNNLNIEYGSIIKVKGQYMI